MDVPVRTFLNVAADRQESGKQHARDHVDNSNSRNRIHRNPWCQ
jgi:hypothetical protein